MENTITWFEVPVKDFERAYKFYSEVFDSPLLVEDMGVAQMAFFTHSKGGVGGAICKHEEYVPSTHGVLVYFNAGDKLDGPLSRVEKAGGKILIAKKKITDEIGYMAVVLDTEGNRIALHSPH